MLSRRTTPTTDSVLTGSSNCCRIRQDRAPDQLSDTISGNPRQLLARAPDRCAPIGTSARPAADEDTRSGVRPLWRPSQHQVRWSHDREVLVPLFEMTREDLVECNPVTFAHLEIKEQTPVGACAMRPALMAGPRR